MNYVYGAIGGILLLVADFFAGYHFGGLAPKLATANTVIKQEAAEQAKDTKDQATVAQEAKTYEAATDPALDPIAAPRVSMCYYAPSPTLPSTNTSGSGAHASAPVPAAAAPDPVPGPDIGRPIVQVGHDANAQVAGLQDYIERVCQAKAP
jgi:hypothetical protein